MIGIILCLYAVGMIVTAGIGAVDIANLGGLANVAREENTTQPKVVVDIFWASLVWPWSWYETYREK